MPLHMQLPQLVQVLVIQNEALVIQNEDGRIYYRYRKFIFWLAEDYIKFWLCMENTMF